MSSSSERLPQGIEKPDENKMIYGTDRVAIVLRLKARDKFTVHAYMPGTGLVTVTNEGINNEIKIVEGVNQRVPSRTKIMYFDKEQFIKFGFDLSEAKMRQIETPHEQNSSTDPDITGIRAVSKAAAANIGPLERVHKTG